MNELLGDKLIFRAIGAKRAEPEITYEEAAIDALVDFDVHPLKILELRDPLAKAVEFILSTSASTVDQQR